MSELGLPYLPSSLVWTKKSLDKYSYCLPYLPIQKVWTFLNWSLSLNIYFLTFVRILLVNNHAIYNQGHLKMKISLGMTWNIKKSLPNHGKKIITITIFEILHTFIGMDIKIWPTYPENFCPNFFFGKSMAQKYPTYLQFGHMSELL